MSPCQNCQRMHRRAQKAEGEVARLQRQLVTALKVNMWASAERQIEAVERDRMALVIQRSSGEVTESISAS